jgi:hypothetical protein
MAKKPTKKGKAKSAKPSAKNTKSPKTKAPKEKKKREVHPPARLPFPSAAGIPNPLLIGGKNKRALCIALAHCTGGSVQDDGPQDQLLMKCIRESGVCQVAGLQLKDCTDESKNKHIAQSEQSGRGYAIRTGRAKHDDYMAQYPEKVDAVMPFAEAFVKIMSGTDAKIEKSRDKEIAGLDKLVAKIETAQAAEQAKKKTNAKASTKKPAKKPAKKPTKVLKGKKPAKMPAKKTA